MDTWAEEIAREKARRIAASIRAELASGAPLVSLDDVLAEDVPTMIRRERAGTTAEELQDAMALVDEALARDTDQRDDGRTD